MLALLLLVATLGSPQPTPTSSAVAGPLREIIRVHSTSLCENFDSHVNAAIGAATQSDQSLAGLIQTLGMRSTGDDLNANGLRRRRAIDALVSYADSLTANWKNGEDEVRRLRELAENATDPTQKIAIKASADALGGVLWRQREVARDLDGFVAYLYAEEMRWGDASQGEALGGLTSGSILNDPSQVRLHQHNPYTGQEEMWTALPGDENQRPDDRILAQSAAGDFKNRLPDILSDESSAAANIIKAGERC